MQAAQILWAPGHSTSFWQSHAPRCQAASVKSSHPDTSRGLAGELRRGEDIHGTPLASIPQLQMLQFGNIWGSSTEGRGTDPLPITALQWERREGHSNALWTRGRAWLRSGFVDEMEELSWPPSLLSGRHCRKRPVSRCRSPQSTDPWTQRNVHRSSLEKTQGSARSAGPAQSLPAPRPSPVASWVSQLG